MGLPLDPPSPGWQGKAHLVYRCQNARSVPVQTFTQAPLKVQRPLYPEAGGTCHTVLVHTAGGMVGGDRLDIDITLEPHCQALLTTAAASKIYGSPQGQTHQTVQLSVAADSALEWFPQDTIVFNQAQYHQALRVDLAPGATWCGWEITRFGRSARGEQFDQGRWRSWVDVWQGEQLLWRDRQGLEGGGLALQSPNGLAGYPVVGSLALVGYNPSPEQIQTLRSLWHPDYPGTGGITRLQQGLLSRYRGPSSQVARQWFTSLWQQIRPWYLSQSAQIPRVWQR
jgi:urease accessory protein